MRKLALAVTAAVSLAVGAVAVPPAQAASFAAPMTDGPLTVGAAPQAFDAVYTPGAQPLLQPVQYFYGGRNYCFYDGGWRGPGWYRCGFAFRRGYGWGGGLGWHGWDRGGHGGFRGGGRGGDFHGDRGGDFHGGGHEGGGREGGFHGGGHEGGGRDGGGHGGGGHEGGGHEGGGDHHH